MRPWEGGPDGQVLAARQRALRGRVSIDFVGRKWLWYSISGLIVAARGRGLYFRGLDMGIEFTGGAEYRVTVPTPSQVTQDTADELREAVAGTGIDGAASPVVTTSGAEASWSRPSR